MFEAALQHEVNYPVTFGGSDLDPDEFASLLPTGYVQALREREKEYLVLHKQRLYCQNLVSVDQAGRQGKPNALTADEMAADAKSSVTTKCGAFVGSRKTISGPSVTCARCEGTVCSRCGACQLDGSTNSYCCSFDGQATGDQSIDFDVLVRGRDYQLCPNSDCEMPIYLGDGVNHMTCKSAACRTQYCFICAQQATHDSGHWAIDMPCPRFSANRVPPMLFMMEKLMTTMMNSLS